jgi:N-acetylmuramic acid 6-phosphate etherase
MLTEQSNPRTRDIDRLSTLEIARIINDEDKRVALVIEQATPQIAQAIDAIVNRIQQGGRLIYVGAGTSGRLGLLDAVECVPTFGTPPELVVGLIAGGERAFTKAVEGAEDNQQAGRDDLDAINVTSNDAVVGVAASGRTPYVVSALKYANEIGCAAIGIACNQPAPLLDVADIKIALPVGPEVITGSTRMKAGTAQKMVLNMLSTATMIKLGKVYGNLMVDVQTTNEKLVHRARRIVSQVAGVDETAAADLLAQSGNDVKVAIVMGNRRVSADSAREILQMAGGHLREILND